MNYEIYDEAALPSEACFGAKPLDDEEQNALFASNNVPKALRTNAMANALRKIEAIDFSQERKDKQFNQYKEAVEAGQIKTESVASLLRG